MENTTGSPPATNTNNAAIQDLIKSCRAQLPNGSDCQSQSSRFLDVQHACDELLSLTFHSEDGRRQVIEKLTTLDGNFVVKIIRKGLVSLSKVYDDSKTFEEESLNLIDLCCLQSEFLMNGCGHQLASPAVIIDWAVALCDELQKSKEVSSCSSTVLMSRCLSKLRDIYETIVRARFRLNSERTPGMAPESIETFKVLFETLMPRIQGEGFEELIEQTLAIIKTEETLDFLKFSRITTFKIALVLSHWLDLLNILFLPNWFAAEVAKHDFLVHDDSYAKSLPFSDYMTYTESLVCGVGDCISSFTSSVVEEKEFFCSKDKAKVLFEYSQIFLRHTSLCLQLMQSKEIRVDLIKNLFFELGIKLDRSLLPVPTNSDLENCDFEISPDTDAMFAKIKSLHEQDEKRSEHNLVFDRFCENSSFEAITKALLTLPEKHQVLSVVQLWKQNFPGDTRHLLLSQLLVLVKVVVEGEKESISSNMEHLVDFLSHLPTECLFNLSSWQPTMVNLIASLPRTWHGPEVSSLIRNLANIANNRSLGNVEKIRQIPYFVLNSLKESSKSEEVKIKALKLGLELFEQVPHPEEYRFALNVIHSIASDMETDGMKTFTLSLLKTARVSITRIHYQEILQVISLIDQSRSIRCKSEAFESYLKLLQEINHHNVFGAVIYCIRFLQMPIAVDTDSVKLFFSLAATNERLKTCQFILKCLDFNQKLFAENSHVYKHMIFLISIVERTLCKESCELFFESVDRYIQPQKLFFPIDIFEIILASIAGCIAVGKFDGNRFDEVLRVVQAAIHAHRMDQPNAPDVLSLLIRVAQNITKAQRFGKEKDFANRFSLGLRSIATLPLSLPQIIQLMGKITSILDQEKITDDQKLLNVMLHLFQLPINESASSLDSEALDLHFKEVVKPRIIRSVAEIPLMQKHDPSTGSVSLFSLMEALVERMPQTFANKTSSSLYQFIIERVEENPRLSLSIFPVVEVITKRHVSEAKLKEEIEEIEEILLRLPAEFIPFISCCLRECYVVGLRGEEQSLKCLIVQIIECLRQSDLNFEDGLRMINSILDIPRQLVLAFKEASALDEARKSITRIFDVVKICNPEFIAGRFLFGFPQDVNEQLRKIVQHDFYMLLRHMSLTASDLCTVMLVYQSLKRNGLLNVLILLSNQEFASVLEQWFSGTNKSEVPTPGNLAYLVMQQLRRLKIPHNGIQKTTLDICCAILVSRCFHQFGLMPMIGIWSSPSPKEYLDMIITIMKESSHLAEIQHWLKTDCMIAVQCKDVIKEACSWRAGSKTSEEAMHMNTAVSETLSNLISKNVPPHALSFLGTSMLKELEVMKLVLKTYKDKDVVFKLFELLCTSTQCAEACMDLLLSWSKEQSLLLIDKITDWYKEKRQVEVNLEQLNNEMRIPLQVLSFAAKAFPNSAKQVFNFLETTTENTGPEDHRSLGRLPVWYKQMTDAEYDRQAIQAWCTSFVLAQNSCSSDVDSLADLTPEMIKVLTAEPESNQITKCLFCLQTTQHLQTDKDVFKRCLVLARLLKEFACILSQLKENLQVVQRIQQGVGELCSTFLDDTATMGNLYKIRYKILESLFVLLFQGENGEHEESLRQLASQGPFSKSLVILFRRLARSVVSRPTTFGHIKTVVTTMLRHNAESPNCQDQDIKRAIQLEVLHFESNQDTIDTLQAAGYNQCTSTNEDLWYSPSIQMSAYVPTVKSFESSRKESLLRQLWREWKTILTAHGISAVEVSEQKLKQGELFKMSDSLEAMEIQLKSVQQAIRSKPLMQNDWSYYRQKELQRNEKRLRNNIAKQVQEVEDMTGKKLIKMVIAWENQLLESVKMCSEKIPDCYAPNGFHSEKPVICGIAADNRILALYKEDQGGTRTEVENVEVKLYPAGMVVFGAYRSIHSYDTKQLWAAFYKMLLDKRLVPKIFITNVSPAFDWIKQFIDPEEPSSPSINFISCCNLIPPSEDSFDYDPETELLAVHAAFASSQTKELIILTREKTAPLQIDSIKAPVANRKLLMKKHIDEVMLHLKKDGKLQEMHPELRDRDKILKRLRTPITKAVEVFVDGGKPTQESISRSIDMKRLLPQQGVLHDSQDKYSAVILDAVNTVTGDFRGSRQSYDGCQHVVFFLFILFIFLFILFF